MVGGQCLYDRHIDCMRQGKTTLADALIASNGIISQRQAGKVPILNAHKILFVFFSFVTWIVERMNNHVVSL